MAADWGGLARRYARNAAAFRDKVARVPADRWDAPSPCPEWTARDVVRHVVDSHATFLGFIGEAPGERPSVDDDLLGAVEAAVGEVQARLDDPAKASAEFDGLLGRTTFGESVDRYLTFDLVVHGWDLARAAGLDETIDPDELRRLPDDVAALGPMARSPKALGPEVAVPVGADEQTTVLALLGRTA